MGIDIDTEVKAIFFRRWMSVRQMKECIEKLEDTDIIYPNIVGNLSVVCNSDQQTVGYIDFAEEQLRLFV